jgi:hypothetical protein
VASVCSRWSHRSRPICGDGSDTSTTVKRRRCCKLLNRGYAADFGRWCGSNGNGDGRGFASFANGVWGRTWRRKLPAVLTARGASPTRPPRPSLCRMLTLSNSDSRLWSCGRLNPPNRRMRTRMSGGVAGEAGRPVPLCRWHEKKSTVKRQPQRMQGDTEERQTGQFNRDLRSGRRAGS